jgi:hypothetical protein
VAKEWAADQMETVEPKSDTDSMRPGPSTQKPHIGLVGRKHVLEKIVKSEEGKRKYSSRRCNICATHKKKGETRYICKFCLVPIHKRECFQRYHSLKHY